MKVKDLIAYLQSYDENLDVKFATGPDDELDILSAYTSDDSNTLWFDIGDDVSDAAAQSVMLERYEAFGLDPVTP